MTWTRPWRSGTATPAAVRDGEGVQLSRILAGQKHAPVVYFARIGDNVKIGTSTNLRARMRALYLSLDDVLALIPGGEDVEDACHRQFAESRHPDYARPELFCMSGPLSRYLHSLHEAATRTPQEPPSRAAAEPATPAAVSDGEPEAPAMMPLRQACAEGILRCSLDAARKAAQRPGFPAVAGWNGLSAQYYTAELQAFADAKVRVIR